MVSEIVTIEVMKIVKYTNVRVIILDVKGNVLIEFFVCSI